MEEASGQPAEGKAEAAKPEAAKPEAAKPEVPGTAAQPSAGTDADTAADAESDIAAEAVGGAGAGRAAGNPAPAPKPGADHLPPPKPDMLAGTATDGSARSTARPVGTPVEKPGGKPARPEADTLFARVPPKLPDGPPQHPVACSLDGATIERVEQPEPEVPACHIPVPVELSALEAPQGIDLTPDATLDCALASSFSGWVRDVVAPAARSYLGSDLKGLRIASSFQCRRRNNLSSGKISEHAKGNAVDISAFRLADGRIVTVADGWKTKGKEKAFLMHVRKEACDRFLTVLSPEGDAYHQDHMHLDQGCHGKTCTYRICH